MRSFLNRKNVKREWMPVICIYMYAWNEYQDTILGVMLCCVKCAIEELNYMDLGNYQCSQGRSCIARQQNDSYDFRHPFVTSE